MIDWLLFCINKTALCSPRSNAGFEPLEPRAPRVLYSSGLYQCLELTMKKMIHWLAIRRNPGVLPAGAPDCRGAHQGTRARHADSTWKIRGAQFLGLPTG